MQGQSKRAATFRQRTKKGDIGDRDDGRQSRETERGESGETGGKREAGCASYLCTSSWNSLKKWSTTIGMLAV